MNFFEKEMRQMFDDNDIFHDAKFVGKTMLAKLDEDLRIKLQFIANISYFTTVVIAKTSSQ